MPPLLDLKKKETKLRKFTTNNSAFELEGKILHVLFLTCAIVPLKPQCLREATSKSFDPHPFTGGEALAQRAVQGHTVTSSGPGS